ncbi:MAG: putative PEP-binding protein [Bacillota bacterium]
MAAVTTDGYKLKITAHVESPEQLGKVKKHGADGIGLLKAVPFIAGCPPPEQEERNFSLLLEAGRAAGGKTVTVLLSDPDKDCRDHGAGAPEAGVCRGLRGVRLCLEQPEVYHPQLRAILRAGAQGRYELALPMAGHVSEIIRFKEILGGIRAELEEEGVPHCPPAVGIMAQVPAVIPTIETIIYESSFFILDEVFLKHLTADHRLPRGEDDYLSFYHHAFLLQAQALSGGLLRRKAGARICGPLVRDPAAIPVLVGLSFNEIIAPPELIPEIKRIVGSIDYPAARMVASKTMSYPSPGQAREYAWERLLKFKQNSR